jgi:hypothetical protein
MDPFKAAPCESTLFASSRNAYLFGSSGHSQSSARDKKIHILEEAGIAGSEAILAALM